jgi:hypothetical protein
MTLLGHIRDGQIVPDEPVTLPEGVPVRIELMPTESAVEAQQGSGQTLSQKLLKYAGKAEGLPSDLARRHDHYIHGTPDD